MTTDDTEIELKPEDLIINTYVMGREFAVRVVHIPTGRVGTSESHRSKLWARKEALQRLKQVLQ